MANELAGWRPRAGVNDTSANGRGPQGVPGERGERGIQGERGERGEKGERGERGAQGAQGEKGAQGERGEKGERGERGAQGAQGEKGAQGERGEKGERGERGAQGIQGERGLQGEQGLQGLQGDKGSDGKSLSDEDIANYLNKNYPNLGKNHTPEKLTPEASNNQTMPQVPVVNSGDGKKKDNKALLIGLGAAALAAIVGLIMSGLKKKKEKENLEAKNKDKKPEVADNKEKEQKEEPEKVAENKESDEKLNNVNLSLEYDNNSSELSPKDKKALEAFAEAEKEYQDKYGPAEIPVVGTASKNGPKDVNQKLGSERAGKATEILKAAGLTNTSISVNLADDASTLDSNGNDRHAGSRNDRTTLISFGLKDEKGLAEFYEKAEKNLIKKGMTPKEAKEYIEKVQASQKGSKIDLHASNNPESGKFYDAARNKDGAFKNYDDQKQGFVDNFEKNKVAQTGTSKDAATATKNAKDVQKDVELTAENKENKKNAEKTTLELGTKETKNVKTLDTKDKDKEANKKKTDLAKGIDKSKKNNKEDVKKKGKDRV